MASFDTDSEYDFVEQPSRDYFCPVTYGLLTDPRQTNSCCGRHLSRAVAERLEAEGKPCPICKRAPLQTTDDLFFRRKVMELRVRCSQKRHGCEWVGELGDLSHHLNLGSVEGPCKSVHIECPYKCGQRGPRGGVEKHKTYTCVKRPFICKHCSFEATYDTVMLHHRPRCLRRAVLCPNRCTRKRMKRQLVQSHLDEECPQQEIDCKFSFAGCSVKVKRQRMVGHLEECKDEHLDTLLTYTRNMKSELTALQLAFTRIAPRPVFIQPPEMEIKNFDKLKNEKSQWFSPAFYTHVGGYKMCLGVDTYRWEDGIGVWIYMMKGEFDSHLKWPFKGEVSVVLMNQVVGGRHLPFKPVDSALRGSRQEDYDYIFKRVTVTDRSLIGWGFEKFLSYANLYKPEMNVEFLKEDTLKFRITNILVTSV